MLTLTKIKRSYIIDHIMPSDLDKNDIKHGLYLKEKMIAEMTDDYVKSIIPDWKNIERQYRRHGLTNYMDKIICGEMSYDEITHSKPVTCEAWLRWKNFNSDWLEEKNMYDFDDCDYMDKKSGYSEWIKMDDSYMFTLDHPKDIVIQMKIVIIGDQCAYYFPFQDSTHSNGFEYVDDELKVYDCSTWDRVIDEDYEDETKEKDLHLKSDEMIKYVNELKSLNELKETDEKLKEEKENILITKKSNYTSYNLDLNNIYNDITDLLSIIDIIDIKQKINQINLKSKEKDVCVNNIYTYSDLLKLELDSTKITQYKNTILKYKNNLDDIYKLLSQYKIEFDNLINRESYKFKDKAIEVINSLYICNNKIYDIINDINLLCVDINILYVQIDNTVKNIQLCKKNMDIETKNIIKTEDEYYRLFFRNRLGYSVYNWFLEDKQWNNENYPNQKIRTIFSDPFRVTYTHDKERFPYDNDQVKGSRPIISGHQFVKTKNIEEIINICGFTIIFDNMDVNITE